MADLRTSLYFHVTGRTLSAKEADAFWNAGKQGAGVSSGLRGNSPSDGGRRLDGGQLYRSQSMSGGRARDEGSGFGGQAARGGALGNQNGNQREGGRARSGSQIPGRAAETGGFGKAKSGGFSGGSGNLMTGEETGRGTGAGGAALRGRSAYLSSMKSGEEAVFMAAGRGTQAGVYAGGGAKGRTSYTSYSMEDVQKAESFVRYLDRGGNLFKSREITAENEELLGCLCADLEMKGQLFADGFRVGDRMKTTVRSAVGNMIDCYLKEAEHRIQAGQDNCPLNRKAVYGVYYYILKQYQQKKDPALILDEGILYASNMFEEKKKEEGYRQAERYSREAGFFGAGSSKEEEKNGRRKGRRLFSDSWGRYMQLAERYGGGYRELMQTSPWGMGLSPEPVRGKNILGKTAAVLGVSAAVAGAAYWLSYMLR